MYRSLKKTLTSSLTVQYAIGPVLLLIYKLGQDFSGNSNEGFVWQDVLIPFLHFWSSCLRRILVCFPVA